MPICNAGRSRIYLRAASRTFTGFCAKARVPHHWRQAFVAGYGIQPEAHDASSLKTSNTCAPHMVLSRRRAAGWMPCITSEAAAEQRGVRRLILPLSDENVTVVLGSESRRIFHGFKVLAPADIEDLDHKHHALYADVGPSGPDRRADNMLTTFVFQVRNSPQRGTKALGRLCDDGVNMTPSWKAYGGAGRSAADAVLRRHRRPTPKTPAVARARKSWTLHQCDRNSRRLPGRTPDRHGQIIFRRHTT